MSFETNVSTRMARGESLFALELLPVVEQAAIESAKLMGNGDRDGADQAATTAMRQAMDLCDIYGRIVIGEGERDEAPMLYIGEQVGRADSPHRVDIAVDPLEGTNLCATGANNAITVMAVAETGGLIHAPDIYMEKLVVPARAKGRVSLDAPVAETVATVAECLQLKVNEIVAMVLDRPRHEEIIGELREAGARIRLIGDGDLSAAISAAVRGTGVHMVMGIGGAPEGVITAAAMKCLGGEILARFKPKTEEQTARCLKMGVDPQKIYNTDELAPGENIVFLASGVTNGDLLRGVDLFGRGARVNSICMAYASSYIQFVDSIHMEDRTRAPMLLR
ncbi:MAG: class II fructose-bisphosphatase [bacterium]